MVEKWNRETTFSATNSPTDHLNAEQLPQNKLLNADRGHQSPRKAAHSLQKEVGQNIKDKKRDKRGRDGDPSQEGILLKREKFPTPGNTFFGVSLMSLGISEGKTTGRKNK